MQLVKNKFAAIIIIALLAASIGISIALKIHRHTHHRGKSQHLHTSPPRQTQSGVGQQTNIVFWLDTVIQGAGITNNIRFQNYNLTIVAPDGTKTEKIYPTVVDTTSSQYYQFTPDQVGTYNLYFNFPGQVYQLKQQPGLQLQALHIKTTPTQQAAHPQP